MLILPWALVSRAEARARRYQSVVGLLARVEVVGLRLALVLVHLRRRDLDEVLEEPLMVLALVADPAVLLLRLVVDSGGIDLAALTPVRRPCPVRQALLLGRAFDVVLCVQLTRREQWALPWGEVLRLRRQGGGNFLACDRRPHAVSDSVQIRRRVPAGLSEARSGIWLPGQPHGCPCLLGGRMTAAQITLPAHSVEGQVSPAVNAGGLALRGACVGRHFRLSLSEFSFL